MAKFVVSLKWRGFTDNIL